MNCIKETSDIKSLDGELLAQRVYPDGSRETIFHEKNMIMLVSKQRLLSVLYSSVLTPNPINSLHVGIGGTVDPMGLLPKAVHQNLTSLYSDLLSLPTYYQYNGDIPSITFITDLDQGMGNGQKITEAGLFTADGTMFNIKCFPGIDKTSEFSIHFEWTIRVS